MLDFSLGEIGIIMLVALLVIGPKHLPALAHTAGKWWQKWRKLRDSLAKDIDETLK